MDDLTMEEKAKLFNFGIAIKELAKKQGFVEQNSKFSTGYDIDEWNGQITIRLMTTECAKREEIKKSEIIEVA